LLIGLFTWLVPGPGFAHYPFPCSQEEKEVAVRIDKAIQAGNQSSVAMLSALLCHENPRIQTASLMGVMRLSQAELEFGEVTRALGDLKDATSPFVTAAAEATQILLNQGISARKRMAKLIAFTESKQGYRRRMGVEALRQFDDSSVLAALSALANDGFGDHDDRFDMKALARVAFDVWWPLRAKGLSQAERLRILVDTLQLGEPYRSRWCDAACELLEKEGQNTVPLLILLAQHGDRRSKLWARRTLRAIGGRDAVDPLLACCANDLDSSDTLLRQSAAYTLSQLADKRMLPALGQALKESRDPQVRERVVVAIGRIHDTDTITLLRAALSDTDETVKTQAAAQLARKGCHDGDAILLKALACCDGSPGPIATGAMGFIHDQDQLADRIIEILQAQPSITLRSELDRILFKEVRNRILRELTAWDREKLRPMASALGPVLEKQRNLDWRRRVLEKLGD